MNKRYMTAGSIQLRAIGIQDSYLTSNPQITYFKIVYKKHANFVVENVIQKFKNNHYHLPVSCVLPKLGDLIARIYVSIEIPSISLPTSINGASFAWSKNLGYALIEEVSVQIADITIDRQYGEWMYIWSQLRGQNPLALHKMVGNVPLLTDFSSAKPNYTLYVPLEFWFCQTGGLALPISVIKEEVKINVVFRKLKECYAYGPTHSIQITESITSIDKSDAICQMNSIVSGYVTQFDYLDRRLYYLKHNNAVHFTTDKIYKQNSNIYVTPDKTAFERVEPLPVLPDQLVNAMLHIDYIYLDVAERDRFLITDEYLMQQVKMQEIDCIHQNVTLNIDANCSVKAVYWVGQLSTAIIPTKVTNRFDYHGTNKQTSLFDQTKLTVNDVVLFDQPYAYHRWLYPHIYHNGQTDESIHMYSFSMHPQNYQPSGTLNLKEMKSTLHFKLAQTVNDIHAAKIRIYLLHYTMLTIKAGKVISIQC